MIIFLFLAAIVLLLLTILSTIRTFKQGPRAFFEELDTLGFSNASVQMMFAFTGVYALYLLTVMNYFRPLIWFGAVAILESLLFALYLRKLRKDGLLALYYRNGIGLYVSCLLHIAFLVTALYQLGMKLLSLYL